MDKEKKAIERIKMASEMSLHHYGRPLVCTYSGGKDSDVMLEIFKKSGIPFEVHNSHTTADAPQTVRHIRKVFRELELHWIRCPVCGCKLAIADNTAKSHGIYVKCRTCKKEIEIKK